MSKSSLLVLVVEGLGLIGNRGAEIGTVAVEYIDLVQSENLKTVGDRLLNSVWIETRVGWTGEQNLGVNCEVLGKLGPTDDLLRFLQKVNTSFM